MGRRAKSYDRRGYEKDISGGSSGTDAWSHSPGTEIVYKTCFLASYLRVLNVYRLFSGNTLCGWTKADGMGGIKKWLY